LGKAWRIVRDWSTGGQKSVHECFLTSAELQQLTAAMRSVIDEEEDSLIFVRIDSRCRVETLGRAVEPVDPEVFYFG